MDEKGIAVGKTHTIMHNGMSWVVVHHPKKGARSRKDSRDNVVLIGQRSYFTHIGLALRCIYNSNLKGVKSIEEMMLRSEEHFRALLKIGKEVRDAVSEAEKRALDIPG